jgi:hypothetical protein
MGADQKCRGHQAIKVGAGAGVGKKNIAGRQDSKGKGLEVEVSLVCV